MTRPYIVGVAGGTGSGKTTRARASASAMPQGTATLLEHDSYYRDCRDTPLTKSAVNPNFDHPDSLETELLVEHLEALRRPHPVDVPIDDLLQCTAGKTSGSAWRPHR